MTSHAAPTSGETTRVRRAPLSMYLAWSSWQPDRFGPWDLTDEALANVQTRLAADLCIAHRSGRDTGAIYREWCVGRDEQDHRAGLRDFYGAQADGTDVYDEYARLGHAPSYWLAEVLRHSGVGPHQVMCQAVSA